ncbi:DNA mismatch repair protein MutS [Tenacibaculum litopenaei]|uniref:MutS-related protein n=1 Tax=Tenacibaculum litopenaei TaxID=396016 RepID=UPI003893B113
MTSPINFYTNQVSLLDKELEKTKKTLNSLRIGRLLVFLSVAACMYFYFSQPYILVSSGACGLAVFTVLVVQFQKFKHRLKILNFKRDYNLRELAVLNGDTSVLTSTGKEFSNPSHSFSHDIDLFGQGSFFQYVNRTVTRDGKQHLATLLTSNDITEIANKQAAVKELAAKAIWRQDFSAKASTVNSDKTTDALIEWIKNYRSDLPKYSAFVPLVFGGISVVTLVLTAFGILPIGVLVALLISGLAISVTQLKKTQAIYTQASAAKDLFKQYQLLLEEIENQQFEASLLVAKQRAIESEQRKASAIIKQFSKILDAFDQRNNIIVALVGNGLFLWDWKQAYKAEQWLQHYQIQVASWFEAVQFFDAYNSLANYQYNHPEFCTPELQSHDAGIEASSLAHPLLKPTVRVANDFGIQTADFFIVTGANMAGKSTFLRTVALAIVSANCGLPVCANSFKYRPIKLITSMRTADSLAEDESYFYSELKRLKFIVDTIKTDRYFIILDEILKGTNSFDKAQGSKQFVHKLSRSNSTGIIATHDVSLCELATEVPSIHNYFFEATITGDELSFDYTMKTGICKNMNASFLLKKMEIV